MSEETVDDLARRARLLLDPAARRRVLMALAHHDALRAAVAPLEEGEDRPSAVPSPGRLREDSPAPSSDRDALLPRTRTSLDGSLPVLVEPDRRREDP